MQLFDPETYEERAGHSQVLAIQETAPPGDVQIRLLPARLKHVGLGERTASMAP